MSWAEAVAALNDVVLDTFQVPVTIVQNGVSTVVQAVFETAEERFNNRSQSGAPADQLLDGLVLERSDSVITALTDDLEEAGAAAGAFAEVDGRRYRIIDVLDDQCGMTAAVLRAAWR